MKYWYLRPRQDYSIARIAHVLEILDNNEYDARVFVLHEKDKKGDYKPTLCIRLHSYLDSLVSEWAANRAVRKICELSDAVDRDFKVLYFEFPDMCKEQKSCVHRKDGICKCPTNSFTPFKCPWTNPDVPKDEKSYHSCPDWEAAE